MTSPATVLSSSVLADRLPGARLRDGMLVLGFVGMLTVVGQVLVPLPFTPVPLSLATFGVVLGGATLGPVRAGVGGLLYVALGMAGVPLFGEQTAGWAFASFGYILGYVPAAVLAGALARRRADRSVLTTVMLALAASAVVYAFGLPWLMVFLQVDFSTGLDLGVTPFLIGDAIKAAAAAMLLPAAWRMIGERD